MACQMARGSSGMPLWGHPPKSDERALLPSLVSISHHKAACPSQLPSFDIFRRVGCQLRPRMDKGNVHAWSLFLFHANFICHPPARTIFCRADQIPLPARAGPQQAWVTPQGRYFLSGSCLVAAFTRTKHQSIHAQCCGSIQASQRYPGLA
jgi:hypothetical protein